MVIIMLSTAIEQTLVTWNGLTLEEQTDIILALDDYLPWELEAGIYEIDEEGVMLLEGSEH